MAPTICASVRKEQKSRIRKRRPAWYKATDEDKGEYTSILDEKLSEVEYPESLGCADTHCKHPDHSTERDKFVIDILCNMIETTYECIPLSSKPKSEDKGHSKLPSWRESVKPFRDDSLFWHSVWVSAARPKSGSLHSVMSWSRRKYHQAVKKAKRLSESLKAKDLLEASEKGDKDLMEEIRKSMSKKCKDQTIPESLDGKVGFDNILEQFRVVYENLYNSAGSKDAMQGIKERLQENITSNSIREVEKITGQVVKDACTFMKPGKTDVTEGFTSDIFLHAPDLLFEQLAAVFRSYLVHGDLTVQILSCAFLPLFKGGLKNPGSSDSYRAIAGASQLLKLFEYVILLVWGHMLGSDSLQFGYKRSTSTTQCSWLVSEVARYYMNRGTSVFKAY